MSQKPPDERKVLGSSSQTLHGIAIGLPIRPDPQSVNHSWPFLGSPDWQSHGVFGVEFVLDFYGRSVNPQSVRTTEFVLDFLPEICGSPFGSPRCPCRSSGSTSS